MLAALRTLIVTAVSSKYPDSVPGLIHRFFLLQPYISRSVFPVFFLADSIVTGSTARWFMLFCMLAIGRILTVWKRRSLARLQTENRSFRGIVQDILFHPVFCRLDTFYHHYDSIYMHSVYVAYLSYRIGSFLNLFMTVNLYALARGAILHDFFLYDWRKERPPSGKLHAFEHPKEALKNALRCFPDISPVEKDIITKHMWPLCRSFPLYLETWIVILADKFVAGIEFMLEFFRTGKKDGHNRSTVGNPCRLKKA